MRWPSQELGSASPQGEACPDTPAQRGAHRSPQPCARAAGASQARGLTSSAAPHRRSWSRPSAESGPAGKGAGVCLQLHGTRPRTCLLPGLPVASHPTHHRGPGEGGCHSPSPARGCPAPSPRHPLFFLLVTSAFLLFSWYQDSITPSLCSTPPLCPNQPARRSPSTHGPRTAECCPSSLPRMQDSLAVASRGPPGTSPGPHGCEGWQAPPCGAPAAPAQCSAKHTGTSQTAGDLTASTALLPHAPARPCLGEEQPATGRISPDRSESQTRFLSVGLPGWSHHSWPREGSRPQHSSTHTSKGDTWTLYKNHRRFCTRTWGHGGAVAAQTSVGQALCPAPSPGHDSHFQRIKNEPSTDTQHIPRGRCAGTARLHAWLQVPQRDVTVSRGARGLQPPPPALCIEGAGTPRGWQSRGRVQQPEPGAVSIPAAGTLGRGKSPTRPWKARSTPRTPCRQHCPEEQGRSSRGDAQGAPGEAKPQWGDVEPAPPAGWVPQQGAGSGHAHTDNTDPSRGAGVW